MDVMVEASSMEAVAEATVALAMVFSKVVEETPTLSNLCLTITHIPSINGTSLSAIEPDFKLREVALV